MASFHPSLIPDVQAAQQAAEAPIPSEIGAQADLGDQRRPIKRLAQYSKGDLTWATRVVPMPQFRRD